MLNAWWSLAFVLDLVVLRRGRWTRSTRWSQLLLGIAGAAVLLVIMLGPEVFVLDTAAKSVLAVPLLIVAIESAVRLHRLLRRPPTGPWRPMSAPGDGGR